MNPNYVKEVKAMQELNICIHKAYNKMDVILENILEQLTVKQIYSMILQTNYTLNLLHQNDYIHGDAHFKNIAAVKTDLRAKKKLGNITVPTFGYDWKLIDFGATLYKHDSLTKQEKSRYKDGENSNVTFVYLLSTQIESDTVFLDEIIEKMKKTPEYTTIQHINKDPYGQTKQALYRTMFPEKYLSFLKGTGKIVRKNVLPIIDLIFLAHYGADSNEARDYLLAKLNDSP
jgi:hypothetical protein